MSLFPAALDTPLDSPFAATLSVHGLHFTVCAPANSWKARFTNPWNVLRLKTAEKIPHIASPHAT